jgi:hypothetical protein
MLRDFGEEEEIHAAMVPFFSEPKSVRATNYITS